MSKRFRHLVLKRRQPDMPPLKVAGIDVMKVAAALEPLQQFQRTALKLMENFAALKTDAGPARRNSITVNLSELADVWGLINTILAGELGKLQA